MDLMNAIMIQRLSKGGVTLEYSLSELRILWHLKRNGPMEANTSSPKDSIVSRLSEILYIRNKTISYALRSLDKKCVVIKTYKRGGQKAFNDRHGFDPIIKLELIDPEMYLPPLPGPIPLAAVVEYENEELQERIDHRNEANGVEPSAEAIILALITSGEKKDAVIDKLKGIIDAQAREIIDLKEAKRPASTKHLHSRVQDQLSPDEWAELKRNAAR